MPGSPPASTCTGADGRRHPAVQCPHKVPVGRARCSTSKWRAISPSASTLYGAHLTLPEAVVEEQSQPCRGSTDARCPIAMTRHPCSRRASSCAGWSSPSVPTRAHPASPRMRTIHPCSSFTRPLPMPVRRQRCAPTSRPGSPGARPRSACSSASMPSLRRCANATSRWWPTPRASNASARGRRALAMAGASAAGAAAAWVGCATGAARRRDASDGARSRPAVQAVPRGDGRFHFKLVRATALLQGDGSNHPRGRRCRAPESAARRHAWTRDGRVWSARPASDRGDAIDGETCCASSTHAAEELIPGRSQLTLILFLPCY